MINVRLAFRMLLQSPLVTAVAILSLALGLGANAAIFTLFNRMLLSPLPVAQPERLVNLASPGPKSGAVSCNDAGSCEEVFSYAMFRDLERADAGLSGLAAHRVIGANVAYQGTTLDAEALLVSGQYFDVLGLGPLHGRLIGTADDATPGGHPVAVLSHAFWASRLGSDPAVIGRTILVNGTPLDIVGVAPAGFRGTTLESRPAVFVPLLMRSQLQRDWDGFEDRRDYWAYVFGRLAPGVGMEQAETALNAVYTRLINDVEAPLEAGMSESGMAQFRAKRIVLTDGRRGQSTARGEARMPLLLMFATAGVVLLIACANIANLLLARGAGRGLEMAVRLSLGAGRRHVVAQLLTESVVLALIGGAVSLLAAHWTIAGITALLAPPMAEALRLTLDTPVVLFAGSLALVTGVLFGLFPALHSTRPDIVGSIRANAGSLSVTRGAARFRSSLVTLQIALSLALLIAAGLFLRSLHNVSRADLGFALDNLITFTISPERGGYDGARMRTLFERVEEELAAMPGTVAVTSALVPIIGGNDWGSNVSVEGFQDGPDVDNEARFNRVGANWFGSLGVPLLDGRDFTHEDREGGTRVVIVNEAFARKFGLGRTAVGKRMATGSGDAVTLNLEIVGLVPDVAYSSVRDEVPPVFYRPWRQTSVPGTLTFYVRSPLPTAQVVAGVQQVMARIDPNLPLVQLGTMSDQLRDRISADRMLSILTTTFAALATLLAAIGLYGVLAYSVATRTREIGIRVAVGATARDIRDLVIGQMFRLFAVGGVLGLIAAWFIGRAAGALLFRMSGHDPAAFSAAVALLALCALLAAGIPARRASRIEPLQALRHE